MGSHDLPECGKQGLLGSGLLFTQLGIMTAPPLVHRVLPLLMAHVFSVLALIVLTVWNLRFSNH